MSYNRDLESNAKKMREHNENLKKMAADRLKKNAKWNKDHKAK